MKFDARINKLIDHFSCFDDSQEIAEALWACRADVHSDFEDDYDLDEKTTHRYWLAEAANHIYGQMLWMQTAKALLETIKKEQKNGNV